MSASGTDDPRAIWLNAAKQAALDALAQHTGVVDPDQPWWNLNMPRALDIMLPAALATLPPGGWTEQVSTREALRSELIRQHLAGECDPASTRHSDTDSGASANSTTADPT